MAGIVDERPLVGDRRLDAHQHGVERAAQLGDLVATGGYGEPLARRGHRDHLRALGHPPNGSQGGSGQHPPGQGDSGGERGTTHQQHRDQPVADMRQRCSGGGGDADDWHRPVDEDLALECRRQLGVGEKRSGLGRDEQAARGVDDLGHDGTLGRSSARRVVQAGHQIGEADLEFGGDRFADPAGDVVVQSQRRCRQHCSCAHCDERRQPDPQPRAACHRLVQPPSGRSRYPDPRTVSMARRPNGRSILSRR